MDLLNILHNVKTKCANCDADIQFDELLVSDSGRECGGKRALYVIGILDSYDSYKGKKARCPNCENILDWICGDVVKHEDLTIEIIQDVKDWLNKL